jgi:tRNA (cytidine/uridine-2'-O-)-methyltransferase
VTIALFQPDIPQNTGTILRMAACFGLPVAIIEPAGFPTSDRAFRRAGMDYLDSVTVERHISWTHFDGWARAEGRRIVLASTRGAVPHIAFSFRRGDVLLFGRETNGVPEAVHERADARVCIPMQPGIRSLNLAVSAAVLAGEALRQLDAFRTMEG